MKQKIYVILPTHNEELGIRSVIEEILELDWKGSDICVYVAEDGSNDGTRSVVKNLQKTKYPNRLLLSPDSERLGYSEGIRRATLELPDGLYCYMDSDGQFLPNDILRLVGGLNGSCDFVVGYRNPRRDSLQRKIFSRLFFVAYFLAGGPLLRDPSSPMVLVPSYQAKSLVASPFHLTFGFWWEFQIRAKKQKLSLLEIPVTHRDRNFGTTQVYSWARIPKIAISHIVGLMNLRKELDSKNS